MTFTNNTVSVIIGGATGIGHAVAEALKTRPGRIEVVGRRDGVDISKETSVATYFKQLGPVDHVVVTAGSSAPGGSVAHVDLGAAKNAFNIKFWGSVIVAREAAKHIRPGGTITLTSGFLARRTVPGTFVKTAMNAALEATAKMLAKELAPVRVNIVSPGLTKTEAYSPMDETAREQMFTSTAERLPAGRVAEAADVAAGYLFIIDNPSVTGAVIDIDGGALIN